MHRKGQGIPFPPLYSRSLIRHRSQYLITYPLAKGSIINVVASTYDPSSTGTPYEGRWVSDATRDEVVGHFDDFEPDARAVIQVCSLYTEQTRLVQASYDTALRQAIQVGPARREATPVLRAQQGGTHRRFGGWFSGCGHVSLIKDPSVMR